MKNIYYKLIINNMINTCYDLFRSTRLLMANSLVINYSPISSIIIGNKSDDIVSDLPCHDIVSDLPCHDIVSDFPCHDISIKGSK